MRLTIIASTILLTSISQPAIAQQQQETGVHCFIWCEPIAAPQTNYSSPTFTDLMWQNQIKPQLDWTRERQIEDTMRTIEDGINRVPWYRFVPEYRYIPDPQY
jgi:hypothetical protein